MVPKMLLYFFVSVNRMKITHLQTRPLLYFRIYNLHAQISTHTWTATTPGDLLKMVQCTVHCRSNHCWSHDSQEHLLHFLCLCCHFPPPWWQATFWPTCKIQLLFCMLSSNLQTPPSPPSSFSSSASTAEGHAGSIATSPRRLILFSSNFN